MQSRLRLFLLMVITTLLAFTALRAMPASAHEAELPHSDRPSLPNEQTLGTEHFLLHFTFQGQDAIPSEDADVSGIADYAEAAAESLEYTWDAEIEQFGWVPPPSDGGLGGDDRIDVYFEDLIEPMSAAGYTDMEGGFVGDNPNSSDRERRAAFSYLSLENDFIDSDDPEGINAIEYLQSTIAHEFNHAIQAGYDAYDVHVWIFESTATWMEEEVYPEIYGGVYYLEDVFGQPDKCIVAQDGWYANYAFMKMLDERYGPDVIRSIWENMRAREGFEAIDLALEPYNSSLSQEVRDYGVAILLRDFEEGDLYPGVYLEGSANEGEFTPNDGVESLGVDFIRVRASGLVDVTLDTSIPDLTLRVVAIRGSEADVIDAVGGGVTLDTSAYDEVFALVQNGAKIEEEDDCAFADYAVTVSPSGGSPTPVNVVRSAANYGTTTTTSPNEDDDEEPPAGRPFGGNSAGVSITPSGLGIHVSFTPIVPDDVPDGYIFDQGYVMTADSFGTDAQYYMPGAEESANYDYYDDEDHILSIIESPSPYDNVPDWLADIDYNTPGEFVDVAGTQVLIEDLSDEDRAYFSATVIHAGLFIVVDGDEDRETVLAMVESILNSVPTPAEPDPTAIPPTPLPPPDVIFTPTPEAIIPGIDDGELIAGLSTLTVLLCCSALCIVGAAMGLAAFLLMRRRKPQ